MLYYNHSKGQEMRQADGFTVPTVSLQSQSSCRRVCLVKAGDVPESTKPAAGTLTTKYRHRYNREAR